MTSLRQGTFTREWTGAEGLDPDVTLVSSSSNQVTFLLHRGSLRRKTQSDPAGTGWKDLNPPSRSVGTLCVEDGAGTIWYRGADKHLWRVTGKDFEPLPQTSGLAGSQVNCMVTDSRGRLWIGTDKEIAMWDGTQFQTVIPTNAELPVDMAFLSSAEDGGLWAVANGRVRKAMDRRWILEAESLKNVFTGNLSRMGARKDHHGGVWLYDYGRGLSHIADDGQVRQFGPQEGFPGERVNCFFEDHEGNWWAGLDAGGLVRIRERRFQTIDTSGQVPTKPARSVCEETNGTLWIGTLGDGLARWQAGAFTNLMVPGGTGKGFAFCVYPDAAGRLWVSAGDEDLFVREHDGFKRVLPVVHGVKAILADKAGGIWVGTKSGLYFADSESSTDFKLYEGIGRNEVRALSEDGHGSLWAGAEDGTLFHITGDTIATFQAGQIYPYTKNVGIYDCPADIIPYNGITTRLRSYSINCYMNSEDIGNTHAGLPAGIYHVNVKTGEIRHPAPSSAMVFVEEVQFSIDDGDFGFSPSGLPGNGPVNTWYNVPAMMHRGSNFAFADNHVEFRRWRDGSTLGIPNITYTDPGPGYSDLRWVQDITATR